MPNTFHFTEDSYEQSIISLFKEMGYEYHYGPELETDTCRELTDATIPGALRKAMLLINGTDKVGAVDEAIRQIRELFSQPLVSANVTLTDWLQNGLDVTFKTDQGTLRSDHIKIIDPVNIDNNSFVVANQWTIVNGNSTKRADIVVFVNGLPVSVIELKSPSREVTNSEEAHQQLQNYMRIVPQLFTACQMLVISDMADTRVGTITAPLDRYMEWKTTDGSYESTVFADFETFFNGIFTKHRFIDIIADFTLTMGVDKKLRILAGYHQYFAVKKALDCTKQALQRNDGKIGVFWHTQGSGKSLSMVFYAHQLLKNLLSATLLVLTDRLDLNDQLHNTFAACSDYLRQTPIKATDGEHLYELLEKRKSHGVIFANIQKFKDRDKLITNRSDVIVISDEAHRTQSNTKTKVDTETGELKLGFAAIVRKLLPHAAFIGFTGTPIEQDDNDTREVFGNYIDIYDMTQAVEDGATVPVYYESRLLKLDLDADTLKLLDNEYEKLAEEGAEEQDIKRSKDENARLHALLSAPQTIDSLCKDIIDHYENNRADLLTGKAMIVAIDRATGIDIYKKLIELRPQWKDIICVVMTQGNQDPVEWNDIIGSGARKEELARQFKDNNSPLKIAIVVDMWLTGFDVPSLATMYVYKPMKGHNLMQAIARVNRVFPEKSGGLVVDYIGIAKALKKAMHDYTGRDKKRFGDPNIKTTAYQQFVAALKHCRECSKLATVTFEKASQLKTISTAFSSCPIISIEIPASVETIETSAFRGCSKLATVTFEKGSQLKTIRSADSYYPHTYYGAFSFCPITSIEIPASVETIEAAAFKGCSSLATVTFEKGSQLKTISGDYSTGSTSNYSGVFSDCTALKSIEIPASVETIEAAAFKGCSSLTTVTFEKESQLKIIGGGYGYSYSGTFYYYGAFSDCTALKSIEIPASVETIEVVAFKGCSSLITVTFEKGSQLKIIGGGFRSGSYHGAFCQLKNLMTVDMSACTQVKTIDEYAFYDDSELRLFKIGTETPPTCGSSAFVGINPYSVLKVPSGCADTYRTTYGWKNFASITGLDE